MRLAYENRVGTLWNGDCLEVFRSWDLANVDCIFADPPFNVGKDYGNKVDDRRPDLDYLEWCRVWLEECVRILVPGASLFLHNLPRHNVHLAVALLRMGMTWKSWIAVREVRGPGIKGRLHPDHMSVLWMTKGPIRTFHRLRRPVETCRHCNKELRSYGSYRKLMHPDGVLLGEVWTDCTGVFHRKHKDPARVGGQEVSAKGRISRSNSKRGNQLPLLIPERCILMSTDPGDVVLDPFLGSGTTAEAAQRNGRGWAGIEIGDCGPAIRRIEKLTSESPS